MTDVKNKYKTHSFKQDPSKLINCFTDSSQFINVTVNGSPTNLALSGATNKNTIVDLSKATIINKNPDGTRTAHGAIITSKGVTLTDGSNNTGTADLVMSDVDIIIKSDGTRSLVATDSTKFEFTKIHSTTNPGIISVAINSTTSFPMVNGISSDPVNHEAIHAITKTPTAFKLAHKQVQQNNQAKVMKLAKGVDKNVEDLKTMAKAVVEAAKAAVEAAKDVRVAAEDVKVAAEDVKVAAEVALNAAEDKAQAVRDFAFIVQAHVDRDFAFIDEAKAVVEAAKAEAKAAEDKAKAALEIAKAEAKAAEDKAKAALEIAKAEAEAAEDKAKAALEIAKAEAEVAKAAEAETKAEAKAALEAVKVAANDVKNEAKAAKAEVKAAKAEVKAAQEAVEAVKNLPMPLPYIPSPPYISFMSLEQEGIHSEKNLNNNSISVSFSNLTLESGTTTLNGDGLKSESTNLTDLQSLAYADKDTHSFAESFNW